MKFRGFNKYGTKRVIIGSSSLISGCAIIQFKFVLLKNLFTVHFQFDLLKLETNNTRDDKLNHAWIIAR